MSQVLNLHDIKNNNTIEYITKLIARNLNLISVLFYVDYFKSYTSILPTTTVEYSGINPRINFLYVFNFQFCGLFKQKTKKKQ